MSELPIQYHSQFLEDGTQLCLLPVSHVNPQEPVFISEQVILYPKGSVEPSYMKLVSYPAYEFAQLQRRANALGEIQVKKESAEGAWMLSAMTGVTIEEFIGPSLLAFPVKLDWDSFLSPGSHATHLTMIAHAMQKARAHLSALSSTTRRTLLPRLKLARFGQIPRSPFSAALFYTPHDDESYIIAGKLEEQPSPMPRGR